MASVSHLGNFRFCAPSHGRVFSPTEFGFQEVQNPDPELSAFREWDGNTSCNGRKSNSSEFLTPIIGAGTNYIEIPIEILTEYFWKIKLVKRTLDIEFDGTLNSWVDGAIDLYNATFSFEIKNKDNPKITTFPSRPPNLVPWNLFTEKNLVCESFYEDPFYHDYNATLEVDAPYSGEGFSSFLAPTTKAINPFYFGAVSQLYNVVLNKDNNKYYIKITDTFNSWLSLDVNPVGAGLSTFINLSYLDIWPQPSSQLVAFENVPLFDYGWTWSDYQTFDMSINFLGISRSIPITVGSSCTVDLVDEQPPLPSISSNVNASLIIGANEYWPYDPNDGDGPIYDSETGAQLRSF